MSTEPTDQPTVILIVEDDDSNALLLEQLLSRRMRGSPQFRRADRLSAALREASQGGIDVMLLDLGLPDSQGLDTLVRLREAVTDVPIVVLTGLDDEEMADRAIQYGAQDYVVKGREDGASLARAIRYAMERGRLRRALAAEHRLLLGIMDNIPDQVYLKDTDSRFVSVNPATATFFGFSSPDALAGKTDDDFFSRELAARFRQEEQDLMRGQGACVNREAAITGADGRTRWVITTKVCVRDAAGHATGVLGINRDITARKQAEEALKEYQAHLEELVVERTAQLQRANERLQALDRTRAEFVSNVSHELKSPLASLSLALRNLLAGIICPHPDRHCRSYLERMQQISFRMQQTVEDILDMSRSDAGTLSLDRVRTPFSALVRRVVDMLQPQMADRSIQAAVTIPDSPFFVECDRQRVERVLLNVLGNAIKFMPEGGDIRIASRTDDGMPGFLTLDVEDNGIGIHPEHLPHIGERYFQGNHSPGGTGLGLSISREILEQHGGTLALASPPPGKTRGTLVTIRLPTVEPPELVLFGAGEPSQTIAAQLARHGFRASIHGDGAEAVAAMRRAAPYAAILDFSMAGLDTAGVIAQIKGDPALQNVPLIALTEADVPETKRQILAGFAMPALQTPWRENDLLACLERAVLGNGRGGVG